MPPGARGELPPPGGAAGGGGLANVKFSGGGGGLSAMAADDRDYTSLRVMNISEDTKEADLQVPTDPRRQTHGARPRSGGVWVRAKE